VVFYCVAGILVALPEQAFATPRLGRTLLRAGGVFFIAMALLQAWPGRGYWQGHATPGGHTGNLTAMVQQMSGTSQPGFLSSWLSAFDSFDAAHGWAVNLFVVVALAAIGAALVSGRRRIVLGGLALMIAVCLADWVLVEDLGFLGGTGTDPNSMLPMALLFIAGYVAMVRVPVAAESRAAAGEAGEGAPASGAKWWERVTPVYVFRSAAALGAVAMVVIGTAPMAAAAVNPNADPILTEALNGTPNTLDSPAPQFTLTDQHGRVVSLADLRGHAVALTFLDPVCTSDCPLIAQEFRQTDQRLGETSRDVDFVAIVANPIYRSVSFTDAFDRQEYLDHLANWYFLTGSVPELQRVWNSYGILVDTISAGAMVAHSDLAFVIDPYGHERAVLEDGPGPTQTFSSSFSSLLLSRIDQALNS